LTVIGSGKLGSTAKVSVPEPRLTSLTTGVIRSQTATAVPIEETSVHPGPTVIALPPKFGVSTRYFTPPASTSERLIAARVKPDSRIWRPLASEETVSAFASDAAPPASPSAAAEAAARASGRRRSGAGRSGTLRLRGIGKAPFRSVIDSRVVGQTRAGARSLRCR
jgi:hypothetical protein